MFDCRTQKSVKTILVRPLQGEFTETVLTYPTKAIQIIFQIQILKYAIIQKDYYTN